MDKQIELLRRRLHRERRSRKEAEQIIEEKSRELYHKSLELQRIVAAESRARSEVETLWAALVAFTSSLDVDDVTAHLVRFLETLVPHDNSAVYLLDGARFRLCRRGKAAEEGAAAGAIKPPVFPNNLRHATYPTIISDSANDPRVREWGIDVETGTWMAVPMTAHGRNVGYLTLESRQKNGFDESAMELVRVLANEAAIALENAQLLREAERLSAVDSLTGLYNRRQFDASVRAEFERAARYDLPLSAIMMDLDHFKRVNDTHGHIVGDRVLVAVANACTRGLRAADICARFGGEEFCFLLPQTSLSAAICLAERLRAGVAGLHFETDGPEFTVTASFGVAERPAGELSAENLLERCDQKLYEAKRRGRDRVCGSAPSSLLRESVACR